jgi:thiol-disulfide isomerase/thioredoxin
LKPVLTFLLLTLALSVAAQSDSLQPAYKRFPTVPPFQLLQLDSATTLTKEDLARNHAVLIMFFSPDCDHCQHQTEDLLKDMESFKNVEIVLASFQPFDMIKGFYEKYQLAKYPNIHIGRDTKYFLPPFFKMTNLPYLALYNRKGDLITTFEGNVKTSRLLKEFKN